MVQLSRALFPGRMIGGCAKLTLLDCNPALSFIFYPDAFYRSVYRRHDARQQASCAIASFYLDRNVTLD